MKTSKIALHILYWTANLLIVLWAYVFLRHFIQHFPQVIKFMSYYRSENMIIQQVIMELNFIVLSIMLFFLFVRFRQLLNNLKKDQTFIDQNISLLKKITFGLIIFDLIHVFNHTFIQLTLTDIKGGPVAHMIPFQVTVLFFALLMWGLRHILSNGVSLKQEHDLTI